MNLSDDELMDGFAGYLSTRAQRAADRDARRNTPGSTPTRRGGIPPRSHVFRNSGRDSGPGHPINNSNPSPPPTIPAHILNQRCDRSSRTSPFFWVFLIVALVFLFNYRTILWDVLTDLFIWCINLLATLFTIKPIDKPPCNLVTLRPQPVNPDIAKLEENFKKEIQLLKESINKLTIINEPVIVGEIPENILNQIMDVQVGTLMGNPLTLRTLILNYIEMKEQQRSPYVGNNQRSPDDENDDNRIMDIFDNRLEMFKEKIVICGPNTIPGDGCIFPSNGVTDLNDIKKELKQFIIDTISIQLAKYDADKTGLPDLALESSGGEIVTCEKTKYDPKKSSQITFMGFTIYTLYNLPRIILQPDVVPGKCWAFEGDKATVLIKLMSPGVLISFSMEHIPKVNSPNGKIESAPKDFQVVGYTDKSLKTEVILGVYKYLDNNVPLQLFNIEKLTDTFYEYVELQILSNHGAEFTCIYRFRVHGSLQKLSKLPPNLLLDKFDRVCERGQCIFDSKESESKTFLTCTQDNHCSCSYDKQNNSNTSKDLEILNRKCISGVNGPCGEDNGLEIECEDGYKCIKGRCETYLICLRELNCPCLDDIDCQPGLICNKDEDGESDNMNKCSIPKIKERCDNCDSGSMYLSHNFFLYYLILILTEWLGFFV